LKIALPFLSITDSRTRLFIVDILRQSTSVNHVTSKFRKIQNVWLLFFFLEEKRKT